MTSPPSPPSPPTPTTATGCAAFDEARVLLAEHRLDDALDGFELAASESDDPAIRASAAAHVAGLLLARGAPAEARYWAGLTRAHAPAAPLADLLDAAAAAQEGRYDDAVRIADGAAPPVDPWFTCSPYATRVVGAHARYRIGDHEAAAREIGAVLAADPTARDAWEAVARLAADGVADPAAFVADLPSDAFAPVLAGLAVLGVAETGATEAGSLATGVDGAFGALGRGGQPGRSGVAELVRGVDAVAEAMWARRPGDARILAAAAVFAPRLPLERVVTWAVRVREAGLADACPLVARARDRAVAPAARVEAAIAACAALGHDGLVDAVEAAVPFVGDAAVARLLTDALAVAPIVAEAIVVAGATTTGRGLRIAAVLAHHGHPAEAYAVLVHALGLEEAQRMTAADVAALLDRSTRTVLHDAALARHDAEVAGLLERVEAADAVGRADADREGTG